MISTQFRRAFGQATKNKPNAGKSLPVKQQLLKKRKEGANLSRQTGQSNKKDALVDGLFAKKSAILPEVSDLQRNQRTIIAKTWSKMQTIRLHAQSSAERALLTSKLTALSKLKECSAELYKMSAEINYVQFPGYRRLPSVTPPNPSKLMQ